MPFVDPELEKIKLRVNKEVDEYRNQTTYEVKDQVSFEGYFSEIITSQLLKTLVMDYDHYTNILKIQEYKDNTQVVAASIKQFSMSKDAFLEFISTRLRMDRDAQYNDSSSVTINGVPVRAFAIREPYRDDPLVVISTAKRPPDKIKTLAPRTEQILSTVLKSNYLICGKTGAGKTYLLNYLLNKYFPKDSHLGIIQEFSEIYPPNEFTDIITIPPKKPGQEWNDLQYLTEQSNLMRYDFLIVGEIKSSEAWPFVVNAASGVKCGATIHGESAQMALKRLRTLSLLASTNVSEKIVDDFISKAIEYIVVVEDAEVTNVSKVLLTNNGRFSLENIFGDDK